MPPVMFGFLGEAALRPVSLPFAEREEIAPPRARFLLYAGGRSPTRCGSIDDPGSCSNAASEAAVWNIVRRQRNGMPSGAARRPKPAKLCKTGHCGAWVEERLAGVVVAPNGAPVPGPAVCWKGRLVRTPAGDRRWANAWSPEQIARRLPVDFPEDETMRISHEAIYQALFVHARCALRRELAARLRIKRASRMLEGAHACARCAFISLRDRDQSTSGGGRRDRAMPGHWEGDSILGLGSSAIGTLVEQFTRPPPPVGAPASHDGPWP